MSRSAIWVERNGLSLSGCPDLIQSGLISFLPAGNLPRAFFATGSRMTGEIEAHSKLPMFCQRNCDVRNEQQKCE